MLLKENVVLSKVKFKNSIYLLSFVVVNFFKIEEVQILREIFLVKGSVT